MAGRIKQICNPDYPWEEVFEERFGRARELLAFLEDDWDLVVHEDMSHKEIKEAIFEYLELNQGKW